MLAPGLDERMSSAADVVDALQELLDMLGEDAASLERSKLLRERILSEGRHRRAIRGGSGAFYTHGDAGRQEGPAILHPGRIRGRGGRTGPSFG